MTEQEFNSQLQALKNRLLQARNTDDLRSILSTYRRFLQEITLRGKGGFSEELIRMEMDVKSPKNFDNIKRGLTDDLEHLFYQSNE